MWPFSTKPKWHIDESHVVSNMFFDLAGLMFHGLNEKLFLKMNIGDNLLAKHEPDNEFDPNAVAVYAPKLIKLGHLPRVISARYLSQFRDGAHYVSISKLERITSLKDGKKVELMNIGVRFPIMEGWAQPIIIIKPHGCLTNYKGNYYLYTDSQLTQQQITILDKIVGVHTIESIGVILLEIAPEKFHEFKFKYKFPESAIWGNVNEFVWKVNDEVGISLPLNVEDIEKSRDQKLDSFIDDLAEDEDKLRKQISHLQGQVSQASKEKEGLSMENSRLQEELDLMTINSGSKRSGNKEAELLLQTLLPNINFLQNSIKFICGLRDFSDLAKLLLEINSGNLPKGELINVTKEPWFEIKYATGDHTAKPAGRLYYHRLGDGIKVAVLVGEERITR
jgi:regulator of replication initiation timing